MQGNHLVSYRFRPGSAIWVFPRKFSWLHPLEKIENASPICRCLSCFYQKSPLTDQSLWWAYYLNTTTWPDYMDLNIFLSIYTWHFVKVGSRILITSFLLLSKFPGIKREQDVWVDKRDRRFVGTHCCIQVHRLIIIHCYFPRLPANYAVRLPTRH